MHCLEFSQFLVDKSGVKKDSSDGWIDLLSMQVGMDGSGGLTFQLRLERSAGTGEVDAVTVNVPKLTLAV